MKVPLHMFRSKMMITDRRLAFVATMLAAACTTAVDQEPARARVVCRVATTHVTLEGKLTSKQSFGPPNYGEDPEHDEKETYYILELNNSCFKKLASKYKDAERGLEIVGEGVITLKSKVGQNVIISGGISPAETGHHITGYILDVN